MTLNLKAKIYTDEAAARAHLERIQWPDGPVCPHCGVIGEATELAGKSTRAGVWKCRPCQKPFSVTVGTVFERSKIPLTKWLLATELLTSSKKGISAHQLHRMLGVTYKTAWFMAHRIREAFVPAAGEPPLGGEGKIVEADEAYIGKKDGKRKHKGAGGYGHKRTVLSLVERGGKIRSFKLGGSSREYVAPAIRETWPMTPSCIRTARSCITGWARPEAMPLSIITRNTSAKALTAPSIPTRWKASFQCLSAAWSAPTSTVANSTCSVIWRSSTSA